MSGDKTLTALLDRLLQTTEHNQITVQELVDAIGHRAFPALILVPALIITSPVSGIPGVSALGGLTIGLVAAQYVWGRRSVWLPKFILRRSLSSKTLQQALNFLRRPSALIDRLLRPRLTILAAKPFSQVIATIIMILGLVMPIFEFVPFSSSIIAATISFLCLALVFRDGVLALFAGTLLLGASYGFYAVLA